MNDNATETEEIRQTNLMALHRQLQELAAKANRSNESSKGRPRPLQGVTLVIQGK